MRDADVVEGELENSAPTNGPRPASAVDAGRVVAYSWLMATAAIGVLNLLHADLHEHRDVPPLFHWLRDAALAVPLAATAVVGAALVIRARASRSRPGAGSSKASLLAWVFLASLLFAVLSIPGIQLHGLLFGAEEESVGWLQDALKDGGITLAISFITLAISFIGLVPAVLLTGPPWRATTFHSGPDQAPGSTFQTSAGSSAFLATAGSTHAGGDR